MGKPKPRPWAPEEIKILKRAYPAGGHKVTHKALEEAGFTDRSPRAVLEAAIRYGVKLLPEGERLTPTGLKALRALAEYGPTYTWEFPALVNAGAWGVKHSLARARRLGLVVSKRNGKGANLPLLWDITAKGERYLKALKGK